MMNHDPRKKQKVLAPLQYTNAGEMVAENDHG